VGDTAFLAFQLKDPEETFQKAGVADLNGDGAYDFVIKQPSANIDPADSYWYKSPETYKIEAYLNDGTRLWDKDLGWAIERGIWYSPYIVYDLNGDGRAEVAAKIGEGDPRDEDGRVRAGPEWVVVWDGMTGDELARAPWPTRDGIRNYNLQSRNQIAVAYLDGKTPCLLTLRGTYGRMKVDAYHMPDGNLVKLWSYDNENYGSRFWGQGAHFTLCADIDGDSRDEVILGSAVLDDNGVPLWTTGRGHPDAHYLSDIDPDNPGLELAYVMESRQRKGGGLNVVDAAGGRLLWKLDTPTRHVHGKGICADLDPTVPGLEVYGADADGHKLTESRWLFSGSGDLLRSGSDCTYSFGVRTVYWDADLQKELARGKISDHDGNPVGGRTEGGIVLIADVIGDWREELITSVKGELRVYTTTIPAMDRRVCLMQDPNYRLSTAMNAMGYTQNSTVLYNPEMRSPNLNLTLMERGQESPVCRIVVSAPAEKGLSGDVQIVAPEGVEATPAAFSVNLSPGERIVRTVDLSSAGENRLAGILRARLATAAGVLAGQVPVKLAGGFIKRGIIFQAEAFAEQTGGAVHIRDDKAGTMGKSISHWDDKGHTLTWRFDVPEAGTYRLVARYCTPKTVTRNAEIDGRKLAPQTLPSTGGFGDMAADWEHTPFTADGRALRLQLKPGQHTVRLENTDGNGCNLDYLALVPAN
jgi:rhamnogalacturonan endolyase